MKILLRFLCNVAVLWCLAEGSAHAQGCPSVDKHKLASVMGIDQTLIPILNLEIPNCSNIQLTHNYAKFILNEKNDKLYNGIRSEIAFDYPFTENDTIEYRWSVMIPSEGAPGDETNQWWLIAQWHDQPDPRLSETWATFKAQPPPVAIYVEKRGGAVGIGIAGILGRKISWAAAPTDVWLDLRAIIYWSTSSNGYVSFSVDDYPTLSFVSVGHNMLNSYQHYFKIGQYRAPTINKYSVVHVKNVRIRKL